ADDRLQVDVVAELIQLFGDVQGIGVGLERCEHLAPHRDNARLHVRNQIPRRRARFAYTPAIASSAMIPRPPCRRSSRLAGYGLTMSAARNSRNAASAPLQPTGFMNNVIRIPTTSSITTEPGSDCR